MINLSKYYSTKYLFALLILWGGLHFRAKAQSFVTDSLVRQINLYKLKTQTPVLFLHFDKTVYTNNDNVWFTAYILKASDKKVYKTLALMLINDNNKKVVLEDKFVISNGRCFGNTIIPDSVRAGNYTFIAYTDHMVDGHIDIVFTQPVTIKTPNQKSAVQPDANAAETNNPLKRDIEVPSANVKPSTDVHFYPEGGTLVNNIQSLIGWEVKNNKGNGVGTTAFLFDNGKIIDTIETNQYGLGRFNLKPLPTHNYAVKIYGEDAKTYSLPNAINEGPVISVKQAVVNNILTVNIQNKKAGKFYLICHNYKQIFSTILLPSGLEKAITINLDSIPKGVTQLTIIDSIGRPYAARTFFAHNDQKINTDIVVDEKTYAPRQKVNVKIKLNGKADSGLVSIACVQENRMQITKQRDIESYLYLQNELESTPSNQSYLLNSTNKSYLEDVLLIKGWKRYTWADVLQAKPADTLHTFDNIAFKGSVTTFYDAMLKKPITLINLNRPHNLITTDVNGNFLLNDSDLVTQPERKINFKLNDKSDKQYHVYLLDPYIEIDAKLAGLFKPVNYTVSESGSNYIPVINNSATTLKTVNISAKSKNNFIANKCGDYVCRYNVLNCPNHRYENDNHPAVEGEEYSYFNGKTMVYKGCGGVSDHQFKGIYEAAEFYPADYSKISPTLLDYVSTLYWKHQLKISSHGDTEISFYTGDITGEFKIIVQGVVNGNDVTYGETTFDVKRKDGN